jgi:hypothetical protein
MGTRNGPEQSRFASLHQLPASTEFGEALVRISVGHGKQLCRLGVIA